MQLHEMEEQIKTLDVRTMAIEQILPTLATKDDLRLTTDALQYEIETGFQEAKRQFEEAKSHADRLNEITREQIRFVAMATKADLAAIRGEMATKADLQHVRRELQGEIAALRGELRGDIRVVSKQIAALAVPRRK